MQLTSELFDHVTVILHCAIHNRVRIVHLPLPFCSNRICMMPEEEKKKDYDVTCKRPGCQALFKMATSVVELLAIIRSTFENNDGKSSYPMGSRDTVKSFKLSRKFLNGAVRNCLVSGTYFSLKNVRACIFN